MVLGVVASLASLVKTQLSKTQVDSTSFRLHYKWTTSFCFLCCALVAASDIIGNPIECVNADNVVTTYCWISSTFTINTTSNEGSHYSAHGSSISGIGSYDPSKHVRRFHAYYQWVPFVLFLQGCLFYFPHMLWKSIEGKTLENLMQGLNEMSFDDKDIIQKKANVVKYMNDSWYLNGKYAWGYFLCESSNLFNVLIQMFLLDTFFDGMFLEYGLKVFSLSSEEDYYRQDALIMTFPRVTKCDFKYYGPSGTLANSDHLCVLPQNLLNEKIFLAMWLWFVILATISTAQVVQRIVMFSSPSVRCRLLEFRGKLRISVEPFVRELPIGGFFLLWSIARNVDVVCFRDIITELSKSRRKNSSSATTNGGYNAFRNDDGVDTIKKDRSIFMADSHV